jgi:hypothetical protein
VRYTVVPSIVIAFLFCFFPLLPATQDEAIAAHGCAFSTSPAVAAASAAPPVVHEVLLNEVLTRPASVWNCSDTAGTADAPNAWVELYNPQDQPLDLYAAHASLDSGPGTLTYFLPLGAAIAAHGFLVVFPEPLTFFPQGAFTLRLLFNGSTVIDQVAVPQLGNDESFARVSDGGAQWQSTTAPTIDASNAPVPATSQATPRATTSPSSGRKGAALPAATTAPATGTQPVWSDLHLPAAQTAPGGEGTAAVRQQLPPTPLPVATADPTAPANALNPPALALIALVLLALAGAVICYRRYRRLFRSPPQSNGP